MTEKAPKLNREQFRYFVVTILEAALDRIESGLPDCIEWGDRMDLLNKVDTDPLQFSAYERGALETAGQALSCLQYPVTNGGLCGNDALAVAARFDEACARFIARAWKNEGRDFRQRQNKFTPPYHSVDLYKLFGYPDVAKHAEAFVAKVCGPT